MGNVIVRHRILDDCYIFMLETQLAMKEILIHFRPFGDNGNVRCLNGSAHARNTNDLKRVTCLKCLNPNTAKDFWHRHEEKRGNEMKNY
jgi:hypothetical protein